MAFGRHTSGFNTEVGRYGRAITMFGSGLLALALGSVASAAPVLSFDSVTAVANGTTATPVQITVKVFNSGTGFGVIALGSVLNWTASGTGATVGDLSTLSGTAAGSASGSGYLFADFDPSLNVQASSSGAANWGVDADPGSILQTGTTTVAVLNLRIAAGVTSGAYTFTFPTSVPNGFTADDEFSTRVAYVDGNNGTTTGVITVVPEPVATGYVATAGVVAAGLGFVQRRSRRSRRLAEVAG